MLIVLANDIVEIQTRPKIVNRCLMSTGINPLLTDKETQQSPMCPRLPAKFVPDAETNSGLGNSVWK